MNRNQSVRLCCKKNMPRFGISIFLKSFSITFPITNGHTRTENHLTCANILNGFSLNPRNERKR